MLTMVLAGLITVTALIVTMARINLRRCLGYATAIDLSFTALMLFMFHGTYSGIVAAASACLFMALALTLLVRVFGYERARIVRIHWTGLPEVEWISVSPQATIKFPLSASQILDRVKAVLNP